MTILAMDTSSRTAACGLYRDGRILGECFCDGGLTHSQTSLPMVEYLLRQAGIKLSAVELMAVTAGPGSFTGLRIGIAQIKGLAQPGGTPCVGISTLEALAWNLEGWSGVLAPCLDARRQQVYGGLFQWREGRLFRLIEEECLPLSDFWGKARGFSLPITFLGDGGRLAYDYAKALSGAQDIFLAPEPLIYPRGGSVALCGMQAALDGRFVSAEELEPIYLRLPEVYRA